MISLQSAFFFFLGCFSADLYRISKGERPDGWKVEASWCGGGGMCEHAGSSFMGKEATPASGAPMVVKQMKENSQVCVFHDAGPYLLPH